MRTTVSNSPRWSDPLDRGLPELIGIQGHDDDQMTMSTLRNNGFEALEERYAVAGSQLRPGMRRYNVFWIGFEPAKSTPPPPTAVQSADDRDHLRQSDATASVRLPPCPAGQIRIPSNESDRISRGYRNYHCYSTGQLEQLDVATQLDASIGAASSFILYGTPLWAIHPNCTGFPWKGGSLKLGCYPWEHMDDWHDFVVLVTERYGTFAEVRSESSCADPGRNCQTRREGSDEKLLPRGRLSGLVIWNEIQSQGWGDPSPVLPNRYVDQPYTREQMDVLGAVNARLLREAHAAAREHTRGATLWVSLDHFMQAPKSMSKGRVQEQGGVDVLDAIWRQLAVNESLPQPMGGAVPWGVVTHLYDNGDPRHNLSANGAATFATADQMVREPQKRFLQKYGGVLPSGVGVQPQVRLFASEQGWQYKPEEGMNNTIRARNICLAQELAQQQSLYSVTHNFFQPPKEVPQSFGLLPAPPAISYNFSGGANQPTYEAYAATGAAQWKRTNSNYCCVRWGVGCAGGDHGTI